jgi:hypothetical protein
LFSLCTFVSFVVKAFKGINHEGREGSQRNAFATSSGSVLEWSRQRGCCMEPNLQPAQPQASFSGATGLIVAVAVVAILLIAFPAYRWFFLISLGIGLVVAAILFMWHKLKPVRDEDVENNRPLGLG